MDVGSAHQARAHNLLDDARRCQEQGNLERARALAHKALTLQPDCAATHSLLGCIHQQLGHDATARLHFRAALAVTPPTEEATASVAARPKANPWMTIIALGCILFSGLATLFAFLPSAQKTQHAALLETRKAQPTPSISPEWSWTMPTPRPSPVQNPTQPVTPISDTHVTPTDSELPPAPPSGTILGPVARNRTGAPAGEPTLDQADQASFRGDFDQAATMYEALLRRDPANPRIHQDLAWCYQRLGNSDKATQHLSDAIHGYQSLLVDDPQNSAAQRGITACQAALRALHSSREMADTP